MKTHQLLVQFMHPGCECIPTSPPKMGGDPTLNIWNTGNHTRKFIKAEGAYIDSLNGNSHSAVIEFWGEWEPYSYVSRLNEIPAPGLPCFIHEPFLKVPPGYTNEQNTDPFVFGDHFHYVCCRQLSGGNATKLRYLAPGSVILFGSHLNGKFILDTLFVVGEKFIDVNKNNFHSLPDKVVSRAYFDISIRPIFEQQSSASCSSSLKKSSCCPPESYRLYFGATFKEPYQDMYSFFPCKPFDGNPTGFSRPVIDHPSVNPKLKLNWKRLQTEQPNTVFWKDIARRVLRQGLLLGVFAEMPKNEK